MVEEGKGGNSDDVQYNAVIVGSRKSGKSTIFKLINNAQGQNTNPNHIKFNMRNYKYEPTIALNFSELKISKVLNTKLYDCGGRRIDRKKWRALFPQCHVVMMVVGATDYCELVEDDCFASGTKHNRMLESMQIIEELSFNRWLTQTVFVIVMTKTDELDSAKLMKQPLSHVFPEYKGGGDAKKAKAFMLQKYKDAYKIKDKDIQTVELNLNVPGAEGTVNKNLTTRWGKWIKEAGF